MVTGRSLFLLVRFEQNCSVMYLSLGDWKKSVPAGQCLLVKFVFNCSVMYLSWVDWKKSVNNYLYSLQPVTPTIVPYQLVLTLLLHTGLLRYKQNLLFISALLQCNSDCLDEQG